MQRRHWPLWGGIGSLIGIMLGYFIESSATGIWAGLTLFDWLLNDGGCVEASIACYTPSYSVPLWAVGGGSLGTLVSIAVGTDLGA